VAIASTVRQFLAQTDRFVARILRHLSPTNNAYRKIFFLALSHDGAQRKMPSFLRAFGDLPQRRGQRLTLIVTASIF
jgi:hypothetical protein